MLPSERMLLSVPKDECLEIGKREARPKGGLTRNYGCANLVALAKAAEAAAATASLPEADTPSSDISDLTSRVVRKVKIKG